MATLHCVQFPERLDASGVVLKKPLVEMLARRWQDRCIEVSNSVIYAQFSDSFQLLFLREERKNIRGDQLSVAVVSWCVWWCGFWDASAAVLSC